MIALLGTTNKEVEDDVRKTKGAHIRFIFLKELITRRLNRMKKARNEKDQDSEEKYMLFVMRAYLVLLVGTTIFSNKTKNCADLTYLDYFRHFG
jgi:hypothetical protein